MCAHTDTHRHTHTHTDTHTHTHTQVHTDTHTHTHTQVLVAREQGVSSSLIRRIIRTHYVPGGRKHFGPTTSVGWTCLSRQSGSTPVVKAHGL